jgi:hypothetical protein
MTDFKYVLAPLEDALDILIHQINNIEKRVSALENVPPLTISNNTGELLTIVPFGHTAAITVDGK